MEQKGIVPIIVLITVLIGILLFVSLKTFLFNSKNPKTDININKESKTTEEKTTATETSKNDKETGKTAIKKNVALVIIDPINSDGVGIIEKYHWKDSKTLADQYIKAVKDASQGMVNYKIAKVKTFDHFPQKKNGFTLDFDYYSSCLLSPDDNCRKLIDYKKFFNELDLCSDIANSNIHEIWAFNGPWFGFWEWSVKGGKINTLEENLPVCGGKTYAIMGFSYERSISEMLEDLGHRFEYSLKEIPEVRKDWTTFTSSTYCGTVHIPPNGNKDYDWTNSQTVESKCDGFLTYPTLSDTTSKISCQTWGCTGEGYKKWWLSHIPGLWWNYVINPDNSL